MNTDYFTQIRETKVMLDTANAALAHAKRLVKIYTEHALIAERRLGELLKAAKVQ